MTNPPPSSEPIDVKTQPFKSNVLSWRSLLFAIVLGICITLVSSFIARALYGKHVADLMSDGIGGLIAVMVVFDLADYSRGDIKNRMDRKLKEKSWAYWLRKAAIAIPWGMTCFLGAATTVYLFADSSWATPFLLSFLAGITAYSIAFLPVMFILPSNVSKGKQVVASVVAILLISFILAGMNHMFH